jgi:hypothetical protein
VKRATNPYKARETLQQNKQDFLSFDRNILKNAGKRKN